MRTIGLIGGMTWHSTAAYYRIINERIAERLGGLHSAACVLYSLDFAPIERLQHDGDWLALGDKLVAAAQALVRAGAERIALCTNTMHKLADTVQAAVGTPLLHIADATGARIRAAGLQRVGLLATRFTMEEDFYTGRLHALHGLDVRTPDADGRNQVHDVIYHELCKGILRDESRATFNKIIAGLVEDGCEGVILGCTEIGLLVRQADIAVPLFDTTAIHAEAIADESLAS